MHLIIFFRDSKRKLEELLHQWSEWHAQYVSSSNVIVTLLYCCMYCHTIIVVFIVQAFPGTFKLFVLSQTNGTDRRKKKKSDQRALDLGKGVNF